MQAEKDVVMEVLAQQWPVIAAYVGAFLLFEARQVGKPLLMPRITRHALWAAAVVWVAHALITAVGMVRNKGVDFAVVDYVLVALLTASIVYLLGRLFEDGPESAYARARRES